MDLGPYFASLWQTVRLWILTTVGNIGVTDVIDMLIITFVLYKLVTFLRRSRLGRLARSILLFLAVVWISGRFNLMVINFVTSRAMEMGILALVVLFQPEIRQSLERFGRNNFFGLFEKEQDEQTLEGAIVQVVIACLQMAKEKTGALIVFERKVSLEDEIKTGTRLDARASSELLKNIFYDKAPLHDGAVVIRGGRLVSAGCMLPLSDNVNLSRDLGMRHRAGIGVSEKSDCVVVILSEETGAISVSVEGMLKRELTPDTFERLLRSVLIAEPEDKGGFLRNPLRGKKHETNRH